MVIALGILSLIGVFELFRVLGMTKHPMAIEYDTGETILDGVDLDDGEGYISLNGKKFVNVKEKQDCNLCIKAFTRKE